MGFWLCEVRERGCKVTREAEKAQEKQPATIQEAKRNAKGFFHAQPASRHTPGLPSLLRPDQDPLVAASSPAPLRVTRGSVGPVSGTALRAWPVTASKATCEEEDFRA